MINIDTEMVFNPPINCRERLLREYPRQIIIHWSGANNNTKTVYNTLLQRGLSYHFIINKNGKITQLVSCIHAAHHSGKFNGNSIGICLISRGYKRLLGEQIAEDSHMERIKGHDFIVYNYTDKQKSSLLDLVELLCRAYGIQKNVYTESNIHPNPKEFSGIFGHMHCHKRKIDPGVEVLNFLARRLK